MALRHPHRPRQLKVVGFAAALCFDGGEWRQQRMAWLILFTAGVLEIIWAVALKQSDGFTKLVPMLIVWPTAGASFWLLALAMRSLPAGTAYAVWTGIGAVGVATIEIIMGGAPTTAIRLVSIAAIIAGIVGLRLSSMS